MPGEHNPVFPNRGRLLTNAASFYRGPGPCYGEKYEDRETGPASFQGHGRFLRSLLLGTAMAYTDRTLICIDCGAEFVFTAGEQVFFHDKQFVNDPKRCKQCKAKRSSSGSRVRAETRTTCSACGEETTVPFKPTQGRPVLCRSCFSKRQAAPTAANPSTADPNVAQS
jgi:CxxC-x17-CxxC domain-containing protein